VGANPRSFLRYHRPMTPPDARDDEPERSPGAAPPDLGDPDDPHHSLAPMDFSTFVLSLASSAAVHLGQVPAPDAEQPTVDLASARQIIDILGVLDEKTRGNLDTSEEKLLRSVLYDLRVQYVDARKPHQ
jgi:hypothetical protein